MSSERWLPVVGYEGFYEVSDHGRVRTVPRRVPCGENRTRSVPPRVLTPGFDGAYYHFTPVREGKQATKKLHHAVLEAFVGLRPQGTETRHLDGDPGNNALSNLCWGTKVENAADRISHGTQVRGEEHHNARATAATVRKIRKLYRQSFSQEEIAARVGLGQSAVSSILTGATWRHVA